jgi:HD-GYP domain-containing protein (c-di-GMP phosphodiesterase class II)
MAAFEAIRAEGDGGLRIAVGGNEILVNERALPVVMGPTYSLARRLTGKGIGLIELQRELDAEGLLEFCVALADPSAETMHSQSHLKLGEAMVLPRGVGSELEALRVQNLAGGRADAVPEEVKFVQSLAVTFAQNREVRFQDADELVYQFLAHMAQDENLFVHLAEVRDHNLFTYLHTTNVATLTMGFALRLGLRDRDVHELGVAALLHDLGKSLVPESILNKPGKLTPEEWAVVERHPVDGASILVRNRDVPRLAVVVAYEHHLHAHGPGGYPRMEPARRPSSHAQLVSIADTFDALFARRSYHRNHDILEALELMQDGAGLQHDPWMVDAFTRFLLVDLESRAPLDFLSARRDTWKA